MIAVSQEFRNLSVAGQATALGDGGSYDVIIEHHA